mmetsp:Transcript_6388/g.8885  ORF Transcript_6388/g.8885 Transcript_6388/m.8885 type:complete len:214 (-) Transcript_6388:1504-2145(-)
MFLNCTQTYWVSISCVLGLLADHPIFTTVCSLSKNSGINVWISRRTSKSIIKPLFLWNWSQICFNLIWNSSSTIFSRKELFRFGYHGSLFKFKLEFFICFRRHHGAVIFPKRNFVSSSFDTKISLQAVPLIFKCFKNIPVPAVINWIQHIMFCDEQMFAVDQPQKYLREHNVVSCLCLVHKVFSRCKKNNSFLHDVLNCTISNSCVLGYRSSQ